MLNGTLMIEVSVKKAWNVLIKENWEWAVKNIFPLDFAKYLSYLESKRTGKLLMFWSNFSKYEVCYKSNTKMLYGKFLVTEGVFKLACHFESCRWSEICCA